MTVRYAGSNPAFRAIVEELSITAAVSTGRFRSADKANRSRFPLTAALLDVLCAPYSKKLVRWHTEVLLRTVRTGKVQLDTTDMADMEQV